MSLKTSTDAEFADNIAKGITLVDFWAEWCGPCKLYGPRFEEVAKEQGSRAKFAKLNVEEAEDIAAQFGVQSIPTTMVFKDGKVVFQTAGMLPKTDRKSVV